MNNQSQSIEKKYQLWINIVSVAIPLAVAVLFMVRLPNVEPLSFLPPIYASVNGITAVLLILALLAIKSKNIALHENLMKTAVVCSSLFLVMYVAYHMTSDSTKFLGEGAVVYVYYFICTQRKFNQIVFIKNPQIIIREHCISVALLCRFDGRGEGRLPDISI